MEFYFALVAAVGAKWARPFVADWTRSVEVEIDFVLICQSWLVCPLIFLTQAISSHITQGASLVLLVSTILIIEATALGFLVNWKRMGLFARNRLVVVFFRFFPLAFIMARVVFSIYTSD
jgi:hypothetical protein